MPEIRDSLGMNEGQHSIRITEGIRGEILEQGEYNATFSVRLSDYSCGRN
jgi:hypothetical protein